MKTALHLGLTIIFGLFFLSSCQQDTTSITNTNPNILLIIADDLGKDALSGFSEGSIKPSTPHIDAIRTQGLSFSNFWVYPTCTPTRASIITGKYGYRTQVKGAGDVLSSNETTLQQYLQDHTNNAYSSAIIGKWHLSGSNAAANPETFGIDYYTGLIRGAADDYYRWQLSEDGNSTLETSYITEKFTELSIDWVKQQQQSWFLWLAYTAPHTPFHVPPSTTHNQGNLPNYTNGIAPLPYYMAAIESMDYQIGRFLDNLSTAQRENLVIIFIGDNGSPSQVAQSPYSSTTAKNTLYQGGINTPLFISGQGVTRTGVDDNLINSTDLFATIAELAGAEVPQIHDSKSFKSLLSQPSTIRTYQYSEKNDGTIDQWAIANKEYKLIVDANGTEELYQLSTDPYEQTNLLNSPLSSSASSAKAALEAELAVIRQ